MRNSTIQFGKNTVTKSSAPDLMRVEVEKTRRAFEIGKNCGLFRVPEVLDYNEAKGIAVFERLDGIIPIHDAVPWGEEYKVLADQLGQALAIIHKDLKLPSDMVIPLPIELNLPGNEVYLHGDLSVYNVCIGKRAPIIAIVDWQMTAFFGGVATFGTRYFDLLFFIGNLFNRPTIRYLFSNPVLPVVIRFIDAYVKEACFEYDGGEFSSYARKFFLLEKLYFSKRRIGRRRRIMLFWSDAMIKEFVQLIPDLANKNKYPMKEQYDDRGLQKLSSFARERRSLSQGLH